MCGIFGFWLKRPLTQDDIALGQQALTDLAHRGPDGQDHARITDAQGTTSLFFGHRRLAILDLSHASDQPMQKYGKAIIFNGEIYNFKELRSELEGHGYSFSTSGDTEVLLAAWDHWGKECLDKLDGMYAFALFDGQQLHLVTDAFGEKPLYVAQTADGLYFSSEAPPLIDHLKLQFKPSQDDLTRFLALGFMPAPDTGFRNLTWLPGATHQTYAAPETKIRDTRYWSPCQMQADGGKSQFEKSDIDQLGEILTKSLQYRLRSDVPVGLFLSSGVDSVLIGALAAKELGTPLNTLTVSFSDGTDESQAARKIAEHLQLPHEIIDSHGDESWENMPTALARMYGVPNDNTTAISVAQMSKLARERMIVALSGVGGDEAFFGYNKYQFLYQNRMAYSMPPTLYSALRPVIGLLSGVPRVKTLQRLLHGQPHARFLSLKNAVLSGLQQSGRMQAPSLPDFEPQSKDMYLSARDFDLLQTLPASYIGAVDRGSMRASVEVRTPYLNRELFEFVSQFSPQALMVNGQKDVLRKLLKHYVPPELFDLPKRGFVFPIKRYLETLPDTPPQIAQLDPAVVDHIWHNRHVSSGDSLALRVKILEHFLNQ